MKRCEGCGLVDNDDVESCTSCKGTAFKQEPTLVVDGRYEVERKLGRGSMGVVYVARDVGLGRKVALKIIAPVYAKDPEMVDRFRREAQALATIRNEHVVQIYALGPHQGSYYFAMEYVQGKSLDKIIADHNAHRTHVPTRRAVAILRQIAIGLGSVHAKDLVHRDVKPSNVVIEDDTGRPVLVDFGLARRLERHTDAGTTMRSGTPTYMAPEQSAHQVMESQTITPRTDIYALGCTAFELFAGRPPFLAGDATEMWNKHTSAPAPPLSSVRPLLAPVDPVIARALEKDPTKRFDGCAAFVRALDEATRGWLGSTPIPFPKPARASTEALHVLVVDDDDMFRTFASRAAEFAFAKLKVRVTRASGGEDALRVFESDPAQLILLDYDMPGLDGIETLTRIRQLDPQLQARVLVVSAKADLAHRWRFSVLGVRDFLKKPVPLEELVRSITDIGRRAGWIEQPRT